MWKPIKNNMQLHIENLFTIFKMHYNKDYSFGGEVHNFWECLYVINGDVQASCDDRVYKLIAGDIIFHQPMELHKFSIENKGGATLFIFSFTLDGKLSDYFRNSVFSLNREQQQIVSDFINYLEKKTENFSPKNLEEEFSRFLNPAGNYEIYLQRVFCYLYQLFLSLVDSEKTTPSITTYETSLFKTAVQFMQSNLTEQLTVNDIAKHCNISLSSLKRTFSKFAGTSVHKYFLNLKLSASINLLQSGYTISEVIDLLNFSSQSYFSAAFKREVGSSPSKFKN